MRTLLLAAALAACSQPAPAPAEPPAAAPDAPVSDAWDAASLAGSRWLMNDEPANTSPMIEFTADRASGTTGCNTWSARYQTNGMALGFHDLTYTERACDGGVMETEQAFLEALRYTEGARMEGDDLVLFDIGGSENARFHRVN
jgi:heat shock protein HslJ